MIDKRKIWRETWRLKHPEQNKKMQRDNIKARRIKNPKAFMLIAARSRAKKRNLEFNITVDDFQIPEICPVFNTPMVSPSLDRINPNLGYIVGNVRVISKRANRLKSDMSYEECQMLLKDFKCQR